MEEHPDFGHIDPDLISTETNVVTKSIYKQINIPSDQELRKATRKLDKYQKQVVSVGIKYAKDLVKSRREGNKPTEYPLLMVHGGAGAGKSTVIKVLAQWT